MMRLAGILAAILTAAAILMGPGTMGSGTPAYGQDTVSSGPAAENIGSADSLMGRHHRGHPPKAEAYEKASKSPASNGPVAENTGSADSLMGRHHRGHPPKAEAYEKAQKN